MTDKLKVLFVRPTLGYGGADRVTLNLLQGFDREAYSCDLALMRAEGDFVGDLPKDVELIDLKARSLWFMWPPLLKLVRSKKYDVIYSTCGGASMPMMLALRLARFRGVSVVSERNILFPPNKSRSKRKLMLVIKKLLYKKASWVTAVSKGVKQECESILSTHPKKTIVVNNPIVNQTLTEGREAEVDHPFFNEHEQVIVAVGRFEWQKDYDTLLTAFKQVAATRKHVGLFILGKGPLQERYENWVKEHGLSDAVCFAGFDKNPFKYMKASDVYVLSSRHEGMPGVLIQAMASGAACVATDCPTGPNEVIREGENGFLVPVEDHNALAQRVGQLLDDKALNQSFRAAGPVSVKNFEEKVGVQSYFDFLST